MAAEAAMNNTTETEQTNGSSQERSAPSQGRRQARLVTTAGLVILLAFLTIQWVFALLKPLPLPSATPPATIEGQHQTDLTIFTRFDPFQGNAPAPERVPVETATETQLNLKLFGTFLGETPSAIVSSSDGRQSVYFLGDEIASGVTIKEIRPTQILLDRRGVLETLTLENREEPQRSSAIPVVPKIPITPADRLGIADYVRIQSDSEGGILLFAGRRPEFFEAARLQNGDRLLSIDDVPISAGGAELATLPAKLSQGAVPIEIERNGTRLELELELMGLMR